MGELIILSEWAEKKAQQELKVLEQELESLMVELGVTTDYVIFDANGDPFTIMSVPYVNKNGAEGYT